MTTMAIDYGVIGFVSFDDAEAGKYTDAVYAGSLILHLVSAELTVLDNMSQ